MDGNAGAAAVLRYGETFDDVPLVVNVAGRFDTSETPRSRFTEEQWDQLEKTGSFEWNVRVGGVVLSHVVFVAFGDVACLDWGVCLGR